MTRKDTSEPRHIDSEPESRTHHSWKTTLGESLRGDARRLDNRTKSEIQILEPAQQLTAIEEQGIVVEGTEIFPAEEKSSLKLMIDSHSSPNYQTGSAFHSLATKMGSTFSNFEIFVSIRAPAL